MSESNFGYKIGNWIGKHPKEAICIAVGVLILWGLTEYDSYRIKNEIQIAQEQKLAQENKLKADKEKLAAELAAEKKAKEEELSANFGNVQHTWIKIFTKSTYTEYKGGVYIEKSWFGDDKITVKKTTSDIRSTDYFIDRNSIKTLEADIKEADFKTGYSDDSYSVTSYQFNCQSSTFRKVRYFSVAVIKATTQTEINQQTGKTTATVIPGKLSFSNYSEGVEPWQEAVDEQFKKFSNAVCNQDFTAKEKASFNTY